MEVKYAPLKETSKIENVKSEVIYNTPQNSDRKLSQKVYYFYT